ncbi:DinB family protein [Streptomyces huiliensis]|uniref:DinB family protein n=1 Tax=Streptomyces huiliensis TaxID=2876027 RepID=UPI001CC0166C|nr:DinB family protein [Streptomyces huiliensis]MBZ4318250.1 DinB family protein [Streptomyces huiliensis]
MPTHVIEKDVSDERGTLLAFLDAQRGGIRRAFLGLSDEQVRSRPSASEMSLIGLLKHVMHAERNWLELASGTSPDIDAAEAEKRFVAAWHPDESETAPALLAAWREQAAEVERFVRALPTLEDTFALPPAPWFPKDARVSMRWLLLHLIEEIGRHAGHADIIRESIDGKTAFVLVDEEYAQAG